MAGADLPGPDRAAEPAARAGRVVAVDLGEARLGIAVSDSGRRLASPHGVLRRSGDRSADRVALARLVEEVGATTLVVGLPLGLDGSTGPAARAALEEVAALAEDLGERLGVEVVAVDERLSTAEAHRRRVEVLQARDGARRGGRGGRAGAGGAGGATRRRERPVVDDAAAAVFLQGFLDGLAHRHDGASYDGAPHDGAGR